MSGVTEFLGNSVGSYRFDQPRERMEEAPPGTLPFVTISRQAWAGGRDLANAILRRLESGELGTTFRGWRIYDRELCEKIAAEPDLHASLRALLAEEYHSTLEDIFSDLLSGRPSQVRIIHRIFAAIQHLAAAGRCVIIGRAGVFVTQGMTGGVHVRLIASEDWRVGRMSRAYGITRAEALTRIRNQEEDKTQLSRDFFNKDIADPLHYDAVWNTERVSLDTIAQQIVVLLQARVEIPTAKSQIPTKS